MSAGKITNKTRQAYKFIDAHRDEFSIQMMCRLLGVARAGYYAWREHPISNRAQEEARLLRFIRAWFTASHGTYGASRVLVGLREHEETCSKHRVARLMRVSGLHALHGYRVRHIPAPKSHVLIPNLIQRLFTVPRPNEAWVTDITYIAPGRVGYLWRLFWIFSHAGLVAGLSDQRFIANLFWVS
ncbi:IS3 family transposase [Stenotrophomonas sp. Sm6012]|uniref:IS3 family transposase n=1 Tax=Stenotrophomonas sp. Sm6012 TaxID=3002745 RepID=UPI0027E55A3B|nr:IS3 family transposase [Stenotrophomonas sp. Sm6012]MDQ7283455.1 IS3 family transposase [Stenotrophomonas sp. Sm6012]